MAVKVSPRDLTGRQKAALDAERAAKNEFSTEELVAHARELAWREGFDDGLRKAVNLSRTDPEGFAELVSEFENAE